MNEESPHWSSDSYWTDLLERYYRIRENGQTSITVDLNDLEDFIYNGDSLAYKMMDAMCSVKEHEGMDGYRGAPRLVLALLSALDSSNTNK